MTHDELKHTALQNPTVHVAYEALGPEFEILRQMLKARQDAGLTQAQVAERMGTKPPAVTRLEASLSSGKHSPSLATLRKYAEAVGCRLEVRLVRARVRSNQGHGADALKRAAHAWRVCRACGHAWGVKVPRPGNRGAEGPGKRKGVTARWGLQDA